MGEFRNRTPSEVAGSIRKARRDLTLGVLAFLASVILPSAILAWFLVGPGLIFVVAVAIPSAAGFMVWRIADRGYSGKSPEIRFDGLAIRWNAPGGKERTIPIEHIGRAVYKRENGLVYLYTGTGAGNRPQSLDWGFIREQGDLETALGERLTFEKHT